MNNFWMEDVHSISLEVTELIQKRLKEFGIQLSDIQVDEIYVSLDNSLEKHSNGDYRSLN